MCHYCYVYCLEKIKRKKKKEKEEEGGKKGIEFIIFLKKYLQGVSLYNSSKPFPDRNKKY